MSLDIFLLLYYDKYHTQVATWYIVCMLQLGMLERNHLLQKETVETNNIIIYFGWFTPDM